MLETISSICSKISCEETRGEGGKDNKAAKSKKPDIRMHATFHFMYQECQSPLCCLPKSW
jgi:hypothetical protein